MEPIAIIGMSCRFPGADHASQLWELLLNGVRVRQEIPSGRFSPERYYDSDPSAKGKMTTRFGSFVEGFDRFDARFFGISPAEAEQMDPQQRMLLELTWEALEHAGLPPDTLAGHKIGVFAGVMHLEYGVLQRGNMETIDSYTGAGNQLSVVANRLSYQFDWNGPSIAVNTACSSSLAAIHLACQSLRSGESAPIAVACGVNFALDPAGYVILSKAGLLSPDGQTRVLDASANGFLRGEGAGALVLKPLSAAIADNDPVLAVIRGSALNHDGRSNGLMAPNRFSQERLLREAYANANISPGSVRYVELNGVGLPLSDAVEASALSAVMQEDREADKPCYVGSVKTNVGHLESAAGMAGVIKTILMLQHRTIPASLHIETPNPNVPFDRLSIAPALSTVSWPDDSFPARAGVSAFGFGGTNVHLVLEEAIADALHAEEASDAPPSSTASAHAILPLSARSPEALRALAGLYARAISGGGQPAEPNAVNSSLANTCYSAGARRAHHEYRAFVACKDADVQEMLDALHALAKDGEHPSAWTNRAIPSKLPRAVFFFPEIDAADPSLPHLHSYLLRYPSYAEFADQCAAQARSIAGEADDLILLSFILQAGAARLLQEWSIRPSAYLGAGGGEVVSLYVSGELSLEDAVESWIQFANAPEASLEEQLFSRAVTSIPKPDRTIVIELGTGSVLGDSLQQLFEARYGAAPRLIRAWRREDATAQWHSTLGHLYISGLTVDWARIYPNGRLVPTPAYPWQKQRYWLDAAIPVEAHFVDLEEIACQVKTDAEHGKASLRLYLASGIANLLHMNAEEVDPDVSLIQLGMDSILLVQLKTKLENDWRIELPADAMLLFPSLTELTELLFEAVQARSELKGESDEVDAHGASLLLSRIDQLSDAEVDRLLMQLMPKGE